MEWMAFFFAIRHSEFDYVESTLQEYDIGGYIISAETAPQTHKATDGEHFHFIVEMTSEDYHKFSKRLRVKYALAGRSTANATRGYGKVKVIENLEMMKVYTVKDGNIRSNLIQEELDRLKEKSFKKDEAKAFEDELIAKFNKCKQFMSNWLILPHDRTYQIQINWSTCSYNFEIAQNVIIQHYLEKKARIPPPSVLKNHVKLYFASRDMEECYKAKIMVRFMDLKNPFRESIPDCY